MYMYQILVCPKQSEGNHYPCAYSTVTLCLTQEALAGGGGILITTHAIVVNACSQHCARRQSYDKSITITHEQSSGRQASSPHPSDGGQKQNKEYSQSCSAGTEEHATFAWPQGQWGEGGGVAWTEGHKIPYTTLRIRGDRSRTRRGQEKNNTRRKT